jgi:hypothetical protein
MVVVPRERADNRPNPSPSFSTTATEGFEEVHVTLTRAWDVESLKLPVAV